MEFENNATSVIAAAVQFYYGIDVVFPKAVFHAKIIDLLSYSAMRFKLFTTLLIKEVGGREKRKLAPMAKPFNG